MSSADLQPFVDGLLAAARGDRMVKMDIRKKGALGDLARAFNQLTQPRVGTTDEIVRVSRGIGREGKLTERAQVGSAEGIWKQQLEAVNEMIDDLVRPTT